MDGSQARSRVLCNLDRWAGINECVVDDHPFLLTTGGRCSGNFLFDFLLSQMRFHGANSAHEGWEP
jgi:hypothetical protein